MGVARPAAEGVIKCRLVAIKCLYHESSLPYCIQQSATVAICRMGRPHVRRQKHKPDAAQHAALHRTPRILTFGFPPAGTPFPATVTSFQQLPPLLTNHV